MENLFNRRSFIQAGSMLALAGGCPVAASGATTSKNTVRLSQDVPVLGDYDVCIVGAGPGGVGAVPYAELRRRLESQNHFFA